MPLDSLPLDSLPLEILQHVASHLESSDKSTLYSLVLVNKACHAAASQLRFRRIVFPINNSTRVARDVPRWETVLGDNDAFGSVRRLYVVEMTPHIDAEELTFSGLERYGIADDDEVDELEHAENPMIQLRTLLGQGFGEKEEQDKMLEPLAGLVQRCTGLRDLHWIHPMQFAPCLLRALHETLPLCRLHVAGFELDSLTVDLERPVKVVDAYEYMLATSPNLSSVTVPFTVYSGGSKADYSREAVLHMVKNGLAPNLKEVHLVEMTYMEDRPGWYLHDNSRPPWRGFFVRQAQNESSDAPLKLSRTLEAFTLDPALIDNFCPWASNDLFSNLRSLHLRQVDVETLTKASRLTFPALKILVLSLGHSDYPEANESAAIDQAASAFIQRLQQLESVHLSGHCIDNSLNMVLVRHSGTLRTLSVAPNEPIVASRHLYSRTIELIELKCPNIRDLRLRIPRTMGDRREVAIYRAIGRLPQLTRLSLELDCSASWGSHVEDLMELNESASPEEQAATQDRNNIRNLLIGAAVDEMLVRSIFNTIRASHPSSSSPLQRLRIWPVFKYCMDDLPDLQPTVMTLMQEWLCVRDPTAAAPTSREEMLAQRLIVRDLNPMSRRTFLGLYSDPEVRDIRLGECKDVFRELWPAKTMSEETGTVEVDWHSFPLELD